MLHPQIDRSGTLHLPATTSAALTGEAERLRLHAAFTDRSPPSSRLPFSYQQIPTRVRTAVADATGWMQRRRADRWASFPRWPLDLSADLLADLEGSNSPLKNGATPVLLTHDLDTPEGLRTLVERFLPIEEAAGARSVSYVVPCSWPLDYGLLDEIMARGHELGIHGYDHSNRTPFMAADVRNARLDASKELRDRYQILGYRAPSLVRTRPLLDSLASRYRYDSSIPTSGGLFPVPNNGCASARPFRVCGIDEIPLTLPRDGSLRFLRYAPNEMLQLWQECSRVISRSGGLVSLLTHCEERFSGNATMLGTYGAFVDWVATDESFRFSTPRDLLAELDRL